MRDDRSSFIRNAKESSTELDALAANIRGADGKEYKSWGSGPENRGTGAHSPEEQYGRFRPMSQHSLRPFTNQSNTSFGSMPQSSLANSEAAFVAPYGRTRDQIGGPQGPAPVRGPRNYEGHSNSYGRSESPVPRPPGSSGGDMWKRGVGFD